MRSNHSDSSSYIPFRDGTSSASAQPVIETTAPSDSMASVMANWSVVLPAAPEAAPVATRPKTPRRAI